MKTLASRLALCVAVASILVINVCAYGQEPADPNIPIESVMRKMQSVHHWLRQADEFHSYLGFPDGEPMDEVHQRNDNQLLKSYFHKCSC